MKFPHSITGKEEIHFVGHPFVFQKTAKLKLFESLSTTFIHFLSPLLYPKFPLWNLKYISVDITPQIIGR